MSTPLLHPSRRGFLIASGAVAAGAILPRSAGAQPETPRQAPPTTSSPSGQPATADSGDASAITPETIAAAEILAGISFTPAERAMMAGSIREQISNFQARQNFPVLSNSAAPASVYDPRPRGMVLEPQRPLRTTLDLSATVPPLPDNEDDIAFATATDLSRWIHSRKLTSRRLTDLYLARLERFDEKLKCVITLTPELARTQADRADAELAAGKSRGPLHGIPYGLKDLFDTANIPTTWGAEPYVDRIPTANAVIVDRLERAGAVLVAKLTLGALAMGDIWHGGRTNNPWLLSQGSSGSSAGSAAATAAGLVGFAIGTETWGSIVSPSVRCGCTGLRPTFGRIGRTGAMALCWSLDKIGPMTRSVEDAALVLAVINGADAGDASSIDASFNFDASRSVEGLRIGYCEKWFSGRGANQQGRVILEAAKKRGMVPVEFEVPDWPYGSLRSILLCEAAASFEELTRTNADDQLRSQTPNAWPNVFRKSWFIPGVELVQADRLRRQTAAMMNERFKNLHAVIDPTAGGIPCGISNFTGHPSLTIRCGFRDNGTPHGASLLGRLFDEGTLCNIGMALEQELAVRDRRPAL